MPFTKICDKTNTAKLKHGERRNLIECCFAALRNGHLDKRLPKHFMRACQKAILNFKLRDTTVFYYDTTTMLYQVNLETLAKLN